MYRIDNSSASTTLPTPSAPGPQPNSFFTGGVPASGVAATRVDAEFLNMVQEEISNVVLAGLGFLDKSDRTQLLKAIQTLGRRRLTANLDLYVSASGSDSNNGTSGAPWATLQHAWNIIVQTIDMSGFNIVVHVADGTYTAGLNAQSVPLGFGSGNSVTFLGDPANPAACKVNVNNGHCFQAGSSGYIQLSGFQLIASGSDPSGNRASGLIVAPSSTIILTGNMSFAACNGQHIWSAGGTLIIETSYSIAGGAQAHINATSSGSVIYGGTALAVTVSGTPAFSSAFVTSQNATVQALTGVVAYSGAASGQRYTAFLNGVINTNGGGANFFPGSTAGVVVSGGQYA